MTCDYESSDRPGGARQDLVTSRGRDQRGQARRVERPGRLYLEPVTHLRPPLEESRPEHGVAQEPSLPLDPAFCTNSLPTLISGCDLPADNPLS